MPPTGPQNSSPLIVTPPLQPAGRQYLRPLALIDPAHENATDVFWSSIIPNPVSTEQACFDEDIS